MSLLKLWKGATLVLTDSGGLQEETTALGVPCITLRESTERPVTAPEGTNHLAGTDPPTSCPWPWPWRWRSASFPRVARQAGSPIYRINLAHA